MVSRSHCRKDERGAAVLIVMLAVTMLTAVGVFAAHRAAMVTGASGYDRQAYQTMHLAEYAGRLTASELSEGRASEYLRLATTPSTQDDCDANRLADPALPAPLPCYVLTPQDLTNRVSGQGLHTSLLDDSDANESGSLTPPGGAPVEGLMRVEILDMSTVQAAEGTDASASSAFRTVEVVIDTWAQVRAIGPTGSTEAPTSWNGQSEYARSTSVQALRASLSVPNVSLSLNRSAPAGP